MLEQSKAEYNSQLITETDDFARELSKVISSLTNCVSTDPVPDHLSDINVANSFNHYFDAKVKNMVTLCCQPCTGF